MKKIKADFLQNATNVYRTEKFIVKQNIGILYHEKLYNVLFSFDTYYRRTPQRDMDYELSFHKRQPPNGKRIPTAMHTRIYVD